MSMKSYIAFVTVWHKKDDPSDVSSYSFFVTGKNDRSIKQEISKEVQTYQYWKHTTILSEELESKKESLRRIGTTALTDKIRNEAITETVLLNKKKHSDLRARLSKTKCGCFFSSFKELMDHPYNLFTHLAQELSPGSKLVIEAGVLYIYDTGKSEKYWETILKKDRDKLVAEMKKVVEFAQDELRKIQY